jgi:hypothetical protein
VPLSDSAPLDAMDLDVITTVRESLPSLLVSLSLGW